MNGNLLSSVRVQVDLVRGTNPGILCLDRFHKLPRVAICNVGAEAPSDPRDGHDFKCRASRALNADLTVPSRVSLISRSCCIAKSHGTRWVVEIC